MSNVLFVLTIPTESEEIRLKGGVQTTTTTTTTTKLVDTEPQQYEKPADSKLNFLNAVKEEAEHLDDVTITPVSVTTQRNTFPHRVKSDNNLKNVELNSTNTKRCKSFEGFRELMSPGSKTNKPNGKKKQFELDLELTSDDCMETVLREIFKKFNILNAVWTKDAENRMFQVTFTTEFNEVYEKLLDTFFLWGIGDREGSTICVMNCIASKTFLNKEDLLSINGFDGQSNIASKQGAWDRFMNSVRSRLNVAQVVRDVRQDAAVTFDFVVSLISASILAFFGLALDNTILLVSSMLISPLMGPIIAVIFGTVIKDRPLRTLGLKNELFGIAISVSVGFLCGLVVAVIDDRYESGSGPTAEMMSRCDLMSLLEGVLTAIPSGAAAAISILGGNIGSLVGVAISASLLPPAVNTGFFWALAVVYKVFEHDETHFSSLVKTERYSTDQANELAVLGTISLCLTLCNVICIYVMGIIVLKVKEIAPIVSRNEREFWKHDIKIARDLNRNGFDTDTAIMNDLANMPQEDQKVLGLTGEMLRNMNFEDAIYRTWSPMPIRSNTHSIQQLENAYSTVIKPREMRPRFSINYNPNMRFKDYENPYTMLHERMHSRRATMPTKLIEPLLKPKPLTVPEGSHSLSSSTSITPTNMKLERRQRTFIVTPAEDPLRPNENDERDMET